MTTVYHGGTTIVQLPLAKAGRKNLDFGQGFYVTRRRQQAEDWASRAARQQLAQPVASVYELDDLSITL